MTPDIDQPRTQRQHLGAELRRLRNLTGMSVREVASRAGLRSYATLHRVEAGDRAPSLPEVLAWAEALQVTEDQRAHLVRLTEAAQSDVTPWRTALRGRGHLQDEVAQIEATARLVRNFQPTLVPGLLQTPAYTDAVLPLVDPTGEQDYVAAAAARLRRQQALAEEGREFQFLIAEPAIRWAPAFGVMGEQVQRIIRVAGQPNVWVGVLPASMVAGWHNFVIYEDRGDDLTTVVNVELLHATLTVSDPADVELYRRRYERLAEQAATGERAAGLLRAWAE